MSGALLSQLAALDVRQPWFAPYAQWLAPARQSIQAGSSVAAALAGLARDVRDRPVPGFASADSVPAGEAYEAFVARTGSVPTRDNLHDLFNGLVWLRFTAAKRRLNELQSAEIARAGVGPTRGAVRDAITLFDENGALLAAPPALWEALSARNWRQLFVELRPAWAGATLVVFGHALLEKLVMPRKELTAHLWRADAAPGLAAGLDGWAAGQLIRSRLAGKPFTPLPLLGVPGWHPANQDFSFYDDPLVFRPARRPEQTGRPRPSSTARP